MSRCGMIISKNEEIMDEDVDLGFAIKLEQQETYLLRPPCIAFKLGGKSVSIR